MATDEMVFEFGDFRLDVRERRLRAAACIRDAEGV
jgi:hypothetical protein